MDKEQSLKQRIDELQRERKVIARRLLAIAALIMGAVIVLLVVGPPQR